MVLVLIKIPGSNGCIKILLFGGVSQLQASFSSAFIILSPFPTHHDRVLLEVFFLFFFFEGERNINTYLCIHWLILVCALTRDKTHNLALWG